MRGFLAMLRQIASPHAGTCDLKFTPIPRCRPWSPWEHLLPRPPALTFWLGADGEKLGWCTDITGMSAEHINDMLASGRITIETERAKLPQATE